MYWQARAWLGLMAVNFGMACRILFPEIGSWWIVIPALTLAVLWVGFFALCLLAIVGMYVLSFLIHSTKPIDCLTKFFRYISDLFFMPVPKNGK